MSDPDGDSQMVSSSSSSSADSEAMFPSELEPPSDTTAPQNEAVEIIESSFTPPRSQDLGEAMDTGAAPGGGEPGNVAQGGGSGSPGGWVPQSEFAKSAQAQFEPGASWNNKKARDEYQRAFMQIEDKGFSLKEFGDPFDETEQVQHEAKA